jgi:hypothetical protein
MTDHAYLSRFSLFCLHNNGRNVTSLQRDKRKKRFFLVLHLLAHSSSSYSQFKTPFFHSYINPIVKINKKKTIMDQNPNKPILLRVIAQGNKKVTSKSKYNK